MTILMIVLALICTIHVLVNMLFKKFGNEVFAASVLFDTLVVTSVMALFNLESEQGKSLLLVVAYMISDALFTRIVYILRSSVTAEERNVAVDAAAESRANEIVETRDMAAHRALCDEKLDQAAEAKAKIIVSARDNAERERLLKEQLELLKKEQLSGLLEDAIRAGAQKDHADRLYKEAQGNKAYDTRYAIWVALSGTNAVIAEKLGTQEVHADKCFAVPYWVIGYDKDSGKPAIGGYSTTCATVMDRSKTAFTTKTWHPVNGSNQIVLGTTLISAPRT